MNFDTQEFTQFNNADCFLDFNLIFLSSRTLFLEHYFYSLSSVVRKIYTRHYD